MFIKTRRKPFCTPHRSSNNPLVDDHTCPGSRPRTQGWRVWSPPVGGHAKPAQPALPAEPSLLDHRPQAALPGLSAKDEIGLVEKAGQPHLQFWKVKRADAVVHEPRPQKYAVAVQRETVHVDAYAAIVMLLEDEAAVDGASAHFPRPFRRDQVHELPPVAAGAGSARPTPLRPSQGPRVRSAGPPTLTLSPDAGGAPCRRKGPSSPPPNRCASPRPPCCTRSRAGSRT